MKLLSYIGIKPNNQCTSNNNVILFGIKGNNLIINKETSLIIIKAAE